MNGQKAVEGQFPYQVAMTKMRRNTTILSCGGAIINDRWILTAAHCVCRTKPEHVHQLKLYIGAIEWRKGDLYDVEKIIFNKNFSMIYPRATYDIALLKTMRQIKFSEFVKPIVVGSSFIEAGSVATVSGWGISGKSGKTSEEMLYMEVNTISNTECAETFDRLVANDSAVICGKSEGQGTCLGDSGGPLTINNTLVGIVSFVRAWCPRDQPAVFARVLNHVEWIEKNIKLN